MQHIINCIMFCLYFFIILRIILYKKTVVQISFEKSRVVTVYYNPKTQGFKIYCYYLVITIFDYDLLKYYRTMAKEIFEFDTKNGQVKRWLK